MSGSENRDLDRSETNFGTNLVQDGFLNGSEKNLFFAGLVKSVKIFNAFSSPVNMWLIYELCLSFGFLMG